jgi:hypothetical protein
MIGAQDFIGYFDWTFEYLRRHCGESGVTQFFEDTLAHRLNVDALLLFKEKGLQGMAEYWGYAFGVGPKTMLTDKFFRFEMHNCPSRGYLIETGQEAYHDFCEHCMGWIRVVTAETGFLVDHEHNHQGQCWWEIRPVGSERDSPGPPPIRGADDVRLQDGWERGDHHLWLDSKKIAWRKG